jgi:hypothetical protein
MYLTYTSNERQKKCIQNFCTKILAPWKPRKIDIREVDAEADCTGLGYFAVRVLLHCEPDICLWQLCA